MKLSIVIPAYNEERNLEKGVLNEVANYLNGVNYSYEVLVVDDGSTDQTASMVEKFIKGKKGWRLIKNPHGGKANTVITGLLEAEGEIALFSDMDQATPLNQIEKFFPVFDGKVDIVIGSRVGRKGAPALRKIMAEGWAIIRAVTLGLPFRDTQCGFKAFNQKSRKKIFPRIKDEWGVVHTGGGAVNAGFDVEVLYLAKKYGFKIVEVEVEWKYVDTERVQFLKDALAAIYDILRIRWNDLAGKY